MFGLDVIHTFLTSLDSCVAFCETPFYTFFQNAKIYNEFLSQVIQGKPRRIETIFRQFIDLYKKLWIFSYYKDCYFKDQYI